MKTRLGFVSNSSSSSFVVAVKSEADYEGALMPVLGEQYGKLSGEIFSDVLSLRHLRKVDRAEEQEGESGIDLYSGKNYGGWMKDAKKYHELSGEGYQFYTGKLSSESDETLELMLYDHMHLDIETDKLYFKMER